MPDLKKAWNQPLPNGHDILGREVDHLEKAFEFQSMIVMKRDNKR